MYHAILVDDEALFLRYLRERVPWEKHGVRVDASFASGRAALAYLQAQPAVDLILTDIKMPGMNGIELIDQLPGAVKARAVILVLSGYDEFPLVRKAFLSGAHDYLMKVDVNTPRFEACMAHLRKVLESRPPMPAGAHGRERPTDAVKEYVQNNLNQSLRLDTIAARFGFSPSYLSQLFSRTENVMLSCYIIQTRIRRARELLRDTSRSVTDISLAVGFNSPEHFSRTFRKLTGRSPRQYRDQSEGDAPQEN